MSTVLLVDDEDLILTGFKRILRREPYEIATANSGAEALAVLAQQPIHVMVTDENMPGMSGRELLRRVRVAYPDVVPIVLSGALTLDVAVEAIEDGTPYRLLAKPVSAELLKETLRRALHLQGVRTAVAAAAQGAVSRR
jgi:DNA-binding NtrC family response regulator